MPSARSGPSRRLAVLAAVASAGGLAVPVFASTTGSTGGTSLADTSLVQVPAMLPNLAAATALGAAPADKRLNLGVAVTGSNLTAEAALTAAQGDKSSPDYRRFLTPAQFATDFGVPAARESAIVGYLKGAGFTVDAPLASGTYLSATATVGQIEKLFHVTIGSYLLGKTSFVANQQAPSVPGGLGIAAISGLDTIRKFTTADQTSAPLTAADSTAIVARAKAEAAGVTPDVNVPVVATDTLQPRDLWSVYDQPGTSFGQGQTAGVFGEGESDSTITQLRLFEDTEKLPKVPVVVKRTEGTAEAEYGDNTPSIEWYLDVQALTGMAPDLAQLQLYFSKSLFDADIFSSFATWANDPDGPRQMNASFGECETNPTNAATGQLSQIPYGTELGDELEPVGEPILQQAALEGRTLFSSSGDTGSGCPSVVVPVAGAGNGVAPSNPPLVSYPAASDYAVGVGGTVLNITGSGATAKRDEEASWEDGGGGASHFIAEPKQQVNDAEVDIPCVTDQGGGTTTTGDICRGVPDVAALSGNTLGNGYFIYIDGSPSAEGGTSLSSPLTVGMWARIQAASPNPGGLGFAGTALYSLYDYDTKGSTGSYGRDFFDVVDQESGATNGVYMPGPGWDYNSGLGVFDVAHLMTDLDGSQTALSTAVPAEAPEVANCSATQLSPQFSATDPAEVTLGNDPELDLTKTVFSVDPAGKTMTVTLTGPDFADTDTDGTGDTFKAQWLYNHVNYFIQADGGGGSFTATDGNNNDATASANDTATATLSSDSKTLTLTAPLSELGSPPVGALLEYPSVDAILGVGAPAAVLTETVLGLSTDTASIDNYLDATVGEAVKIGPCTVVTPTPTPVPTTTPTVKPTVAPTTRPTTAPTTCGIYRTSSLRVGGRGPVRPDEKRTYTLRVFADPGACATPHVNGRRLGFFVNGKLRAKLITGGNGIIKYTLKFPKGDYVVSAVFYGDGDLRKSTSPGQKVVSQ